MDDDDLSTYVPLKAVCSLCKQAFDAKRWEIVDLNRRPELIVRACDGTLQRTFCPRCIGPGFDTGGAFLIVERSSEGLGYGGCLPQLEGDVDPEALQKEMRRLVAVLDAQRLARGCSDKPIAPLGSTLFREPQDISNFIDKCFGHFGQHFDKSLLNELTVLVNATDVNARLAALRACPDLVRPNMRRLLETMAKDPSASDRLATAMLRALDFIGRAVNDGAAAAAEAQRQTEFPENALTTRALADQPVDQVGPPPSVESSPDNSALLLLPRDLRLLDTFADCIGFVPVELHGPYFFYLMDLELFFDEEAKLRGKSDGTPFRAALGYVEGEREQASCRFIEGGLHAIRMSTAMAHRILLVAKLVFDKECVTAEYESERKEDFWEVPDVKGAGARLRSALEERLPITEEQVKSILDTFPGKVHGSFASVFMLFHDMLRFAWLHELGHAVLGHARFVAQHRRLLELREFGEPGQPNLDAQLQQALELEADLFAVRLSFWQILHEREVFRLEVDLRGDLPSRLVWLRIACAAMAVLWTSVEGRLPEENASHPPPALRYYNMCTMIDTLARALGLDFTAIGASAAMYVERLNIDCPPFWDLRAADASFFDSPLVQRVRAYQARMQQAVANVREQVDEGEYVSEHPIVGRPPIGFDSGYYRRMKLERVTRFRRLQEGKAKFPGGAEG